MKRAVKWTSTDVDGCRHVDCRPVRKRQVDHIEKGRSTPTSRKRQVEKGRLSWTTRKRQYHYLEKGTAFFDLPFSRSTSTCLFQPGRCWPAFFNLVDVDLPFSTCLFLVVDTHTHTNCLFQPGRRQPAFFNLPFSTFHEKGRIVDFDHEKGRMVDVDQVEVVVNVDHCLFLGRRQAALFITPKFECNFAV